MGKYEARDGQKAPSGALEKVAHGPGAYGGIGAKSPTNPALLGCEARVPAHDIRKIATIPIGGSPCDLAS